jgi:hypothetical protein
MNALGLPAGHPRKPLGRMTQAGADVVRNALKSVFQNSPEILTPIENFYGSNLEERLNDDSVWKKLVY